MLTFPKFTFIAKYPLMALLTVEAQILSPVVIDIIAASKILLWLFLSDFATGIWASYKDWQKIEDRNDKWFFGNGEGFSSDKFKKMAVKASIYLAVPILLMKFQETFMIKNMKYESLSDAEVTLPVFFILLFCLNEFFSIFHENLPRCGFSYFRRLKKIAKVYKETKKEFADDEPDYTQPQ